MTKYIASIVRPRITEPLETGIRAVDAVLPIGRGQRVGIFAGSGVGKSVLLGSLAAHAAADVNVIALVGERGREVREFVERDLGPAGLARSVVVVATADEPPLVRRQAAFAATTVAEFFRDAGRTVLFMMDSLTRLAMAQREVGLAIGEPPTTKGYTPSVFAMLPKLLERAGTARRGSITGGEMRGNAQVIQAMVPLANMFGYVNQLRGMTQGRAQYTMHFDHYEPVPPSIADEVKAKLA